MMTSADESIVYLPDAGQTDDEADAVIREDVAVEQ